MKKNTRASPLELYLEGAVDFSKGCYQGQEGVASLLKNKKGLPRTMYSISFSDEDNFYEGQRDEEEYSNHENRTPNGTKLPQVGDVLYALGSNQEIRVGTITSIAERGGTSFPETIGIALIKRPGPILKKMKRMNLEIERDLLMNDPNMSYYDEGGSGSDNTDFGSGIIMPPPIDPLDGLEVVLENGFTQGQLRVLPSRRLKRNQNLFETEQWSVFDGGESDTSTGATMGFMGDNFRVTEPNMSMDDISVAETAVDSANSATSRIEINEDDAELQAAIEAAKLAADEARRKEEKLAMLKERAEAALKKRKEAKEEAIKKKAMEEAGKEETDDSEVEAEAKRKAEKMEMLRKRAEEAMARRRKK